MKNLYNVLELEKNCTAKEIRESYIKLSKKYHPDKNKSQEAEKKMLEINEAYSVLKNTSTRNRYDERLRMNNSRQEYQQQNVRQNPSGYYYNRFYSYDDYTNYYHKVTNQRYAESSKRKFTVVICCCMLMVFGAGLRIMYAWSEAYHRKRLSELRAERIELEPHKTNPEVEKMRLFFERKREREKKEKKSET